MYMYVCVYTPHTHTHTCVCVCIYIYACSSSHTCICMCMCILHTHTHIYMRLTRSWSLNVYICLFVCIKYTHIWVCMYVCVYAPHKNIHKVYTERASFSSFYVYKCVFVYGQCIGHLSWKPHNSLFVYIYMYVCVYTPHTHIKMHNAYTYFFLMGTAALYRVCSTGLR